MASVEGVGQAQAAGSVGTSAGTSSATAVGMSLAGGVGSSSGAGEAEGEAGEVTIEAVGTAAGTSGAYGVGAYTRDRWVTASASSTVASASGRMRGGRFGAW